MLLAILRGNWKTLLAILLTAGLAWGAHSLAANATEKAHQQAMEAQKTALDEQCAKDKKITAEVSSAYQNEVSYLSARLAELKRVQPSRCVVPKAKPTVRCDATARPAEPAGEDGGVTTDALYDFAFDAEQYRLRLLACQEFIRRVWEND